MADRDVAARTGIGYYGDGIGIFVERTSPDATGDTTIRAAAVSGNVSGLFASDDGQGDLAITVAGDVAGGPEGDGVVALRGDPDGAGALRIAVGGASGGGDGIRARNPGRGELSITATGAVTSERGSGIDAQARGPVTIDVGGAVRGAARGIALSAPAGAAPAPARVTIREGASVAGGELAVADAPDAPRDTTLVVEGQVVGGREGAVALGAGDDALVLRETASIEGAVSGGAGEDALALDFRAPGRFDLGRVGTQFTGFERLTVDGAATLAGTGAGELPALAIRSGEARLDDGFGGAVTVAAGATLSAGGEVGDLAVAGTLSPGGARVQTLRTGDAAFADGATLAVDVGADGRSDRIVADGAVTIDEGATLRVTFAAPPEALPEAGERLIVTAEDGITGRFGTVVDDLPDADLAVLAEGGEVRLRYVLGAGNLSPKFAAGASVRGALAAAEMVGQALRERAEGRADAPAVAGLAFAASPPDGAQGLRLFAGLAGAERDVDARDGRPGSEVDASGVIVGAEIVAPAGAGRLRAGLAFAATEADAATRGGASEVEGRHVAAFAAWEAGPLRLSGAASFGRADHAIARDVRAGIEAVGEADGDTAALSLGASYDVAPRAGLAPGVELRPFAGLDLARATYEGFTETGAGVLDLAVAGDALEGGAARLGLAVAATAELGGVALRPSASLAVERRLGERGATVSSSIAALGGAFADELAPERRDRLRVGVGLDFGSGRLQGHLRLDDAPGGDDRDRTARASLSLQF